MPRPLLVIISGAPGSGKTSLARRLAPDLRLPLITKDDIKERLFDALGVGDLAWSRRLGAATYDLLYLFAETLLASGRSLIVESNFKPDAAPALAALQAGHACDIFGIHCHAESAALLERYRRRERHPGHLDALMVAEFTRAGMGDYLPLPLDGPALTVDTTDLDAVDYPSIRAALERAMAGRSDRQLD